MLGLCLIAGAVAFPQAVPDWEAAWKHAKARKTVILYVLCAETADSSPARVYFEDRGRRTHVASVAFYPRGESLTFLVSGGRLLRKLPGPPSPAARVVVEAANGKKAWHRGFRVELEE